MFTAPALQVIADAIRGNLKKQDQEFANDIADLCEENIRAVCNTCGGDGLMDVTRKGVTLVDAKPCTDCNATGKGRDFDALLGKIGEKNAAVQEKADRKLKKLKK
jgi:hypothetical protein